MHRVLRAVAGLLVLLLVVGLAVVFVLHRALPRDRVDVLEPGGLTVEASAVGTLTVGGLEVEVGDDGVVVRSGRRVTWSSEPSRSFLAAGSGTMEVEEHRGYFWPRTVLVERWTDQRLDAATVTGGEVVLSGELASEDAAARSWEVRVSPSGTGALVEAEIADVDAVALFTARSADAGVHGLGAQFTDFDLDDRVMPLVVREQGVGRGLQPLSLLADLSNRGAAGTEEMTYAAWASWVTDDLQGLRLDPARAESHALSAVDTTSDDRIGLTVWAPSIAAQVDVADSPRGLVAAQQDETSRPPLAGWTQDGAIVGLQGGTDAVRRQVADLEEAGVPVAGVWIQDWVGRRTTSFGDRLWWTWQLDEERYPGWSGLVDELATDGIATTTYVNPFLVDAAPKGDPAIRNLYAEARDAGYLVRDADDAPYALDQGGYDAYLVDLTNPGAREWYADVIATEVLADGVVGFMADFGEGLPFDARVTSGDPAHLHNRWPALWAETVRDACERAGQPECVTWFRSGSLGMELPMAWAGDQLVDFGEEDGLASALLGMLSAGVSGWPLVHSDVGGYTSVDAVVKDYTRSPELLARWSEVEAFGVLMRTHEGNRPDVNTQVSDTGGTRSAFARMARVFAALKPYRAQVVAEAQDDGVPALRHGWLVAPGSAAAEVDTQFLLGDDVLVAPVLEEGSDSVEVTFPPGEWRHLFTQESYDAAAVVEAPLGTPAAFVRVGSDWEEQLVAAVASAVG